MSVATFLRVGAHLATTGVSVPDLIAADATGGFILLEDFGDGLIAARLDGGEPPKRLFEAAIDALLAIQDAAPPAGLPNWDAAAMVRAAGASLYDWWWPASFGAPAPDAARSEIDAALTAMLAPLAGAAPTFAHRDWFAGNLFWLPDRAGVRRIGVIDFQDAALGHPAYDLMALVQDPRRDLPPALTEHATARYLGARPGLDAHLFRAAAAACAAQRLLRVAAQWVRLDRRDGKPHYLAHGPRTWRLLEGALRQPVAAPLARALDRWIPPEQQTNPPATPALAVSA